MAANCWTIFAISLALLATVESNRQARGLVDEAGKMWHNIFSSGMDNFQAAASRQAQLLRPWADRVEQEMGPAMKRVEESLGSAIDIFADSLISGSPVTRRREGQKGDLEGDDDPERDPYTSGPGLHELMFGEPLDPFSIFGIGRKKWWDGENVCIDRKVIKDDEGADVVDETNGSARRSRGFDMSFTTCRDEENLHECTTHINVDGTKETIVVRYECCYGFSRDWSKPGCVPTDLTDMKSAMQEMGVTEFMELLKSSELSNYLDQNVTMFVPSNDAVEDFRHDLQRLNAVEYEKYDVELEPEATSRRRRDLTVAESPKLSDIIKGHIVEGFMDSTDFKDEETISTMTTSDNGSKLRINVYNTYPKKTVMANCAKITSADHFTENGVVHVVDKVILPATKTISEVIAEDVQFRTLQDVLLKTGLSEELSKADNHWTIFAPTDSAFDKLEQKIKEKILSGNGCSADIIKHHMLPNVICSGIVDSKAKTVNALNKYVILEKDEQDNILIEGVKLLMVDIVASNGVIHVIDDVIVPESARSVPEAFEEAKMTTMKELFDLADFSSKDNLFNNVTIFAPSERALKELPESYMKTLKSNPEKLREFLMYHTVSPKMCHCDFADNKVLATGVAGKTLRMNSYGGQSPVDLLDPSRAPVTVQCARVTHTDTEVCGGMVHTVNKVLLPPAGKNLEIVKHQGKYSKFVDLVAFAELENDLNAEGPFTVFAPTDTAFENMKEDILKKVLADKDLAVKVVNHHILKGHLCCAGVNRNTLFFDTTNKRTLGGELISVRRSNGGYLYADRAEITACDMVSENGVVHGIDRVLLPDELEPEEVKRQHQAATTRRRIDPFEFLFNKK